MSSGGLGARLLAGRPIGSVGLGGCAFGFAESSVDDESIKTIRTALDAGLTLLDSALAYTTMSEPSHCDRVFGAALRGHPDADRVVLATKGGHFRLGPGEWGIDGRPETIRKHCEISLRASGVQQIGLYQLHHPDPKVPIEETMGAFARLQVEGKIEAVGLSNVSIELLERARRVVAVASVQNSFSPLATGDLPMVRHCAAHGITYLAYSPLGGAPNARQLLGWPGFAAVAGELGCSVQRLVLAWHLAQSPTLVPVTGASRLESVLDSAAAPAVRLTSRQLARLASDIDRSACRVLQDEKLC